MRLRPILVMFVMMGTPSLSSDEAITKGPNVGEIEMTKVLKTGPEFCGLVASGTLKEIENALIAGASANSSDQRGTPALFYALQSRQPKEVVQLLLRYGAVVPSFAPAAQRSETIGFVKVLRNRIREQPERAKEFEAILELPEIKKLTH